MQPPAGTTMESVDDVIVPVFRGDIVADGIGAGRQQMATTVMKTNATNAASIAQVVD